MERPGKLSRMNLPVVPRLFNVNHVHNRKLAADGGMWTLFTQLDSIVAHLSQFLHLLGDRVDKYLVVSRSWLARIAAAAVPLLQRIGLPCSPLRCSIFLLEYQGSSRVSSTG